MVNGIDRGSSCCAVPGEPGGEESSGDSQSGRFAGLSGFAEQRKPNSEGNNTYCNGEAAEVTNPDPGPCVSELVFCIGPKAAAERLSTSILLAYAS